VSATAVDIDLFREVIGQDRAVAQLRAAAAEPVHAYLFVGPSGSGKRAAAHAFAAALLAPAGADRDDRDARLALAGTHPDLRIVEREGASISAKQADDIVRAASLSPIEGDRKVLVLDEFHLMTAAVAPKLLKTIEEPPAGTIFVVIADDVPPELVTIASRCVRIEFGPVPVALVEATLEAEGAEASVARLAAAAAGGDLDRARLLVADSGLATRRQAWHDIPKRIDGAGATVAAIVDELLELIDQAAEPLKERQKDEADQLQQRIEQSGERGSGRKELEDRHKRELRRHRTDELRFGLATLTGAYRDRLVAGGTRDDARAVDLIQDLLEELIRNPNETLQLQALLLQLPG
jgi:DNA polymerase-3 subunit delta'